MHYYAGSRTFEWNIYTTTYYIVDVKGASGMNFLCSSDSLEGSIRLIDSRPVTYASSKVLLEKRGDRRCRVPAKAPGLSRSADVLDLGPRK